MNLISDGRLLGAEHVGRVRYRGLVVQSRQSGKTSGFVDESDSRRRQEQERQNG